MKAALISAALLLAAVPTAEASDQLRKSVARELPRYGVDVDVRDLSVSQVSAIFHIMHSNNSESEKRALIRSAVGKSYSLRGLLFDR